MKKYTGILIIATAIITGIIMIKCAHPENATSINWFGFEFKYL